MDKCANQFDQAAIAETDPRAAAVLLPCALPCALPPARSDGPRHFDFVDSLRGLAILGVILLHCSLLVPNLAPPIQAIGMAGHYGVQLFFIVSAFTLFSSLQSRTRVDRMPLAAFYTRRFFRIAPLFYLAAIFYTAQNFNAANTYGPTSVHPWEFIATLLFVHGWHPSSVNLVVPGGWSIGAEFMFYLCIPIIFRNLKSLRSALWLTLIATVAAWIITPIAYHLVYDGHYSSSWQPQIKQFVYWSFPFQFPVFCMGFVLYFLMQRRVKHELAIGWLGTIGFVGAVSLFLMLAFQKVPHGAPKWVLHASQFLRADPKLPNVLHDMSFAVGFVALACLLAHRPVGLLVNRVTRFIGTVSFSAYIWHFWILKHAVRPLARHIHLHIGSLHTDAALQFALLLALTILLTMPASALSHWLIELPGQNIGKALISRMGWGKPAVKPLRPPAPPIVAGALNPAAG